MKQNYTSLRESTLMCYLIEKILQVLRLNAANKEDGASK